LMKKPIFGEVKKLLADGFDQRTVADLAQLLGYPDMRVRQEAQFALAGKGEEAIETLTRAAVGGKPLIARIHAVWGLGQIGRKIPAAFRSFPELLGDEDPEIRAQAAKVVGDDRVTEAHDKLLPLLKDAEPRVRFFAAMALGKIGGKEDVSV